MAERIIIHTDGACLGNPGPGGWAAVLRRYSGEMLVKEAAIAGGRPDATNQVMELTAALEAMKCLKTDETASITIVSDSTYLVQGASKWLANWKANGWRKANRKPVENQFIWVAIDEEMERLPAITWEWTHGHSGEPLNEEADRLASAQARKAAAGAKRRA